MDVYSRAQWGARYADGFGPAPLPASECWAHHSATNAPPPVATFDVDAAAIRVLEQIGEDRFGGGISYTWLICPSGRIFQGHSANRQGAHTANRNDRARAICFVGNYDVQAPTAQQLRSAAWLLQYARDRGWLVNSRLNGGHRDLTATKCPGNHIYTKLSYINQLAAGPPIQEGEDMDATQADQLRQVYDVLARAFVRTNRTAGDLLADMANSLGVIEAKLDALSDDEANIIAAVRAQPTGGQVDVEALADALIPHLPAGTTPDQIADAFARRMVS